MRDMAHSAPVTVSEKIRDQRRKESEKERSLHRLQAFNHVRKNLTLAEKELTAQNVTPEELSLAVAKIKQGNLTSHLDLRALKQALFDKKNSVTFFRTAGSLQALVGHLSGRKALHQLEAAYICSNLATGDEYACDSVTNAAGPYLIEYLDGQNSTLQIACLWALGNLSAGSGKSFGILQVQGLTDRLINCLRSPYSEVIQAALYTLCLVLKASMDNANEVLSCGQRQEIVSSLLTLTCFKEDVDWLFYLLSCNSECDKILLGNLIPQKCINALAELTRDAPMQVDDLSMLRSVTAVVRTLGNLASGESGQAGMMILEHPSFPKVVNDLLHANYPHICKEAEWLGMNLLSHPSQEVAMVAKMMKLDKILSSKDHDHVPIQRTVA